MEPQQPPPPQTQVFVYMQNLLGLNSTQASLVIQNVQSFTPPGSGVIVTPMRQVIAADYYGYCSAQVVSSDTAGVSYYFEIQYVDGYNQLGTYVLGWAQVPTQSTALDLSTVTFTQNSDGSM